MPNSFQHFLENKIGNWTEKTVKQLNLPSRAMIYFMPNTP